MKIASYAQISEAEYLALEAQSPVKHEYVTGSIYAMTGASLRHNVIAGNIYTLLRAHLRGSP
ncbi:MAG: Uma2 family endonuclease, partial [Burkholderiaceae bacterium]|nr:Uma2 family endonuclease [Burkholderiaceae bacterium]